MKNQKESVFAIYTIQDRCAISYYQLLRFYTFILNG